jgi:hypothetical protein
MGFSPVALRVPVACLATRHNQGTILSRPICPFTCRAEDTPQPLSLAFGTAEGIPTAFACKWGRTREAENRR